MFKRIHLIAEKEADAQYKRLIESIMVGSYREKAAMLRTQFDTLLHLCVEAQLGRRLTKDDRTGFAVFINQLFPEGDSVVEDLRSKLLKISNWFNKLSAHTYNNYLRQQSGQYVRLFGRQEYEESLDTLSEFVAFVSGAPIPPQIRAATKQRERSEISNQNRLDIVLMVELFTEISELEDGYTLVRNINEMLSEVDHLNMTNVYFRLITYCQPLCNLGVVSDIKSAKNDSATSSLPFYDALEQSLDQIYDALDLKDYCKGRRPWLILFCREIPDDLDESLINEIKKLYSEKKIDFMPIALNKKMKERYKGLWPNSGPIRVSPSLSSNFFNELLLAIRLQINKIEEEP